MSRRRAGILGAGGQAKELAEYWERELAFFAVHGRYVDERNQTVDLENPPSSALIVPVVAGVGAPALKRSFIEDWAGEEYETIVSSACRVADSASIGRGAVIAPFAAVMAEARIGEHVLVNTASVISHESVIGDFATISPNASIGGDCTIGAGVFIGIGATVRDGVHIGDGAVVGAGAVVLRDVDENEIVVGVPARRLRIAEGWKRSI